MDKEMRIYVQLKDGFDGTKGSCVLIRDIAVILVDPRMKDELLNIEVLQIEKDAKKHIVVSILTLMEKIQETYPQAKIFPIGNSEILIKITDLPKRENKLWIFCKLSLVCSILFVGTGLAIMNFHADVNMAQAHQTLYKLITGVEEKRPLIMQIPYSLGIGLGMAIFFNHILPRKFSNEPSPMEVEMYSYRKSMDEYVLQNEKNTEE